MSYLPAQWQTERLIVRDGTLAEAVNYAAGGSNAYQMVGADFTNDGHLDLMFANYSSNSVSLLVGQGDGIKVGKPLVEGARVVAELVGQTRGPKLIAFKKRRRKNSRRKKGHRQDLSKVRITEIVGA